MSESFPTDAAESRMVEPIMEAAGIEPARHSPRETETRGWVYFIQEWGVGDVEPIKIGWSSQPIERCRYLRRRNHGKTLNIIGLFPGFRSDERALHKRWAEHRVLGEWFRPHADIRRAADLAAVLHCESFGIRLRSGLNPASVSHRTAT